MLQPSRTKYRKEMKGRMKGLSNRGNSLTVGDFAMQTLVRYRLTGNQLEAARKTIVRETKRKGKIWLRVFPNKPITHKPAEVRMGGGKGDVDHYVAVVKPGRIIMELGGVDEATARLAFKKASAKLPIKVRFIKKGGELL